MDISADLVPGDYVLLTVADTGSGMTREVLDHLFEPFFTTKEIGRGTGLGLAMVFGIVKQNKGAIQVISEPGKGATFKIYFPRTELTEKSSKAEPPQPGPPRGAETVLLVEDEQQVLDLGSRFLQRCGYNVLTASTPETALELAARHQGKIHLLITDAVMPGMNGRKLQEMLEAKQPGLKTLLMSGYAAEAFADKDAPESRLHFLQKPFTFEGLARKVRDLLDATEG
jgi:two-component system sensor histidine kinase EvgS